MFRVLIISVFIVLVFSVLAQNAKPNILFFLVDDMGVQDTSVPFIYKKDKPYITHRNTFFRTPNMEKLARQGVKFTNAYAYSVCTPTRISIISGQSSARHQTTQWTHPTTAKESPGDIKINGISSPEWNTQGIDVEAPLLPDLLTEAGYKTILVGKAHFGPNDVPTSDPFWLGFDVSIAGHGAGSPASYYGEDNYARKNKEKPNKNDVPDLDEYHGTDTFLTEALTLEMKKEIKNAVDNDKPFFAYMSHYAVHTPHTSPDKRFTENYPHIKGEELNFATLIEGMDKSLGDLMDELYKLGVAENTLIVFYSDNGSNSPLGSLPIRGKKGTRHEGGIRVPCMVAWGKPNAENALQKMYPIQKASINDNVVTCLDWYPTFLKLAGAQNPENYTLDGIDIGNYFKGSKSKLKNPQKFLVHFPHQHKDTLYSVLRKGDYKITYSYHTEKWALFNLKEDFQEKKNLIKDMKNVAVNMAKEMIKDLDEMDALFPYDVETDEEVIPKIDLIK